MRKAVRRITDRVLALILSMMLLVGMMPMSVFAAEYTPGVLSTDIGDKVFVVNDTTEFTFTTTANDDADTMVKGSFVFSDPDAIEKLEYLESQNGQWYEFYGDFGPATGFPMINGTSHFRATFNKAGNYTVTASMKTVADDTVLCSTTANVNVIGNGAVLTTDIGDSAFDVGTEKEFTFTTTANDDMGTMVKGSFVFSDPSAIEKLEYQESQNGNWYEFYGDFGPATGFPMINATSHFRATFNKAGNYTVTASMKTVPGDVVLCSTTATVVVTSEAAELTTDIEDGPFNVGTTKEFTYTTTANDDAGTMVKGSFVFSDPTAIEKLEYQESQTGDWYEFYGDFGPATGFPIIDGTSKFRVTFNKTGNYSVEVSLKNVADDTVVCSLTSDVVVEHKVNAAVTKNEGGIVLLDGEDIATKTVDVDTMVNVSVTTETGYQIESISIDGVEQDSVSGETTFTKDITLTKNVDIDVTFVKVYTATVTHNGTGTGVSNPVNGGFVTVKSGENIEITATPDAGNRVVSVMINDELDADVTGANDSGYIKTLNADKDYTVVITFAPNVYTIVTGETENGTVTTSAATVEHNGSTVVTLTPYAGYTVGAVEVNNVPVDAIVKDSEGVHFSINNITEDQNIEVTYRVIATASKDDLTVNSAEALRDNAEKTFFVMKDGSKIVLSTEKGGIKVYNDEGLIGGSEITQTVEITADTVITEVELFYKDGTEFYAEWHKVIMDDVKIVVDKGDNVEASLSPVSDANAKGYYNSDVVFDVSAEDTGDYSGLALVEYWITLNGVAGAAKPLYIHDTEISNTFTDSENLVVDAAMYNSEDVKVTLHVVDRAGNETKVEKEIKINSTKPTISLDITGSKNDNAYEGYFNDKRELTITVVDRKDTFSKENVVAGLIIKKNGQNVVVAADDIDWTDNDSLHIGKYTFEEDGHYEWSISYENIAGLKNDGVTAPTDKSIYDFYVDKAEPYNLKVTYEPEFVSVLLETLTFGFYNAPVNVVIEAVDDTAEIAQFEYKYTGVDGTVVADADIKRDRTRAYAEFTIPAQFRGDVSFAATDRAGRTTELADDRIVVIDTIAPGVTVEWTPVDAEAVNGKYFNTARKATVKINEANFFAQDVEDGLLLINQTMRLNDGTLTESILKPEFVLKDGVYIAEIPFDQDADYTFDVKYTDRSGNEYDEYQMDDFVIDTIDPLVEVSFNNNDVKNEKCFKDDRTATITVVEHNFYAEGMTVTVNGAEFEADWKPVEDKADTYFAEIPFPGDSHYEFAVAAMDLAGNSNNGVTLAEGTVAPWNFVVDKSSPVDLKISYEPNFVGTLLEGLTFGFYKAPVTVELEARDDVSGIEKFVYSYTVDVEASEINTGKENVEVMANGENFITFDIPAQFRGFVSFTATNMAGVSASIADTNAVVVDDIAPGIQVIYDNNDALNDKYYKADRTATITIDEANYFADDIKDGLLVITRKTVLNDGTETEETLIPEFTYVEGTDKYTATVPFDQDADYTFDIKYTDRSGNVYDTYDMDDFVVDKIKPEISIEKANGAYFNADRTAKITVVEHNFRASDFEFTAEAYDVVGTKIDLSSKDYTNYLKNEANWTKVAADTWEAELTFDIEGNYVIGATYSDLAGNPQVEVISDTFCVDKSNPEELAITYNPTFVGTILETITFGFYKAPVNVTIEATDKFAGVEYFVYSYAVEDGASETNVGKINQRVTATRDGNSNRWYTTFTIEPQFRGNVSFTAYDRATNSNSLADETVIVVDNVAPGVTVTYHNTTDYDENYFDAQRTAVIKITEANFFAEDIADGLLVITVEKTTDDGVYTSTVMSPEFTKNGDVYTAEIPFVDAGDYTFDIKYTDRSGNVYDSYKKDVFTVDMTAPVIKVSYDNDNAKNENQFNVDRTATIEITEHNFDPSKVDAEVKASGREIARYAEYLAKASSWKQVESKADTWQAVIKYTDEAHYEFGIACVDKAGNPNEGVDYGTSVAPEKFTLDKSAPTEMDIKINNFSVAGTMDTHAFDKFYGSAVTVKLSAKCDISGLQALQYQKVANINDYNENGLWVDYNADSGIKVVPSERFVIYFRAEDRAGNVNIIRSTGIVVDNQKPVGEANAPEIDILPEEANENGIHNGDVTVGIKVLDPKFAGAEASDNGHYSGLKKVAYKIYTTDTDAVMTGTLLDIAANTTNGAVVDNHNLISSWSGKITIDDKKFNSNNVIVEVTATDNADNTRVSTTLKGDIKIDITAPKISVSYNNNAADSERFFKSDRTATIVVTERNFDPEKVVAEITNTDGRAPKLSNWKKLNKGTGNKDNTQWRATVTYSADGDYEFSIQTTDLAGWACKPNKVSYSGSVAPTKFTIDKTNPLIAVTYDNNSAVNGNYYKATRTATVVITEHNFNAERVTITHTSTDDGVAAAMPTISGWTANGDRHVATIHYGADARYTFDISVKDKAGNASADYTEEAFVVDTTKPSLEITGVEDKSANNGDVIPVITYSDTNYDAEQVTITLTGANRKEIELDGSYAEIHNGQVFTFNNFAKEKEIDDIYTLAATLTDKAGNTSDETIVFSVNRFGSTYALSAEADKLNGTYVKEPADVVITETNPDELKDIKVTLFKDGETLVLKENEDYTITLEGGDGQWYHYTYTVFAKNFEADGVYSLTVESGDKAGNAAKNDQDTKNTAINFGVDSTLPIINIENLESNTTYALDNITVAMSVKDNLQLTKVIVELDGKEYKEWTAETLEEIILNGGNFTFDISGDSTDAHNLVVYAVDAAGNGEKISDTELPANAETVEDFYVTTNIWIRYYTNKPLFFGSVAGVILLAGLIVFLVVYKKRKNGEN